MICRNILVKGTVGSCCCLYQHGNTSQPVFLWDMCFLVHGKKKTNTRLSICLLTLTCKINHMSWIRTCSVKKIQSTFSGIVVVAWVLNRGYVPLRASENWFCRVVAQHVWRTEFLDTCHDKFSKCCAHTDALYCFVQLEVFAWLQPWWFRHVSTMLYVAKIAAYLFYNLI